MAGSAILALATVASVDQQMKAKKASKKANKAAERQRSAETARQRRQQIRQARIKNAQTVNMSAATGIQGSSSSIGAQGSVQSQLGSNIGFLNTSLRNQNSMFDSRQKAAGHMSNSAMFQQVGHAGYTIFGGGSSDGGEKET